MGNENQPVIRDVLNISRFFPKSPCSVFFGNSYRTLERFPGISEALDEYEINKSIIAKLSILLCKNNGVEIGLGGSSLDQLLIEAKRADPAILGDKKHKINRRRMMVPMSSDGVFYDGPVAPEHDAIHDPGNIDLRILTNNESVLTEMMRGAEKVLDDIGEISETAQKKPKMYNWDPIYKAAWDANKPKDRKKLLFFPSIDDRPLSILRYIFESDHMGIPFERVLSGNLSLTQIMDALTLSADKYRITTAEDESLNIVCNSPNNLRSPMRCFNIDSLVGKLDINMPLIYKSKLRDFLTEAEISIALPQLPEKISIPPEAIAYFEGGIDHGDVLIMDSFSEVVIRSLRKSLTLGVYDYDDQSLFETRRLMNKMAQKWALTGSNQKHSNIVIIKNMRELEVCAEFDFEHTAEMIEKLGIKQIFDLNWERFCQIESQSIDMSHMAKLLGKSFYRHALG